MDIERIEMIRPLFYVQAQANNVRTVRNPPRFMCIVLHQFAKLTTTTLLLRCRTVQNLAFINEMGGQRVGDPTPFLCVNTGTLAHVWTSPNLFL